MEGINGTLAWCFNELRKRDLRESRYDELVYAQQILMQNKPIKPGLEKFFDAQGNLRHDQVRDDEEFDGYSCIFSTKHVSKEENAKKKFSLSKTVTLTKKQELILKTIDKQPLMNS